MKKKLLSFCAVLAAGLGVYAVSTLAEVQADGAATYDVDYAYLTQAPYTNATPGENEWTGAIEWAQVAANDTYRISRWNSDPVIGEVMSVSVSVPNGTYDIEVYAAANNAWGAEAPEQDGSTEFTKIVANDKSVGIPFLSKGGSLPETGMGLFKLEGVTVTDGKLNFSAVNENNSHANWISVNVKSIKPTVAPAEADIFKNGADVTCLLKNPNFSNRFTGWTAPEFGIADNGNMTALYAESWNGSAPEVVGKNIYQEVALPAGSYEFTAECTAENLTCALYAKVGDVIIGETKNIDVKNQKITVPFKIEEPSTVILGYENRGAKEGYTSGAGWISIDNCSLKCVEVAKADDPVTPPVDDPVVAPEGNNLDFAIGTPVTVGICTYAKDMASNGTDMSRLQAVEGWTLGVNDDAMSGGIFAYGTDAWLGGKGYVVPATNPDGEVEGNALGLVAVWSATVQYTQEVEFPAGEFVLTFPIYNSKGGTTTPTKGLFGFIEENGTEHLAAAKAYEVGKWSYETVKLNFDAPTKGNLSVGYTATNAGSGSCIHLFVDCVKIEALVKSDVTALAAAIEEVEETYALGFLEGEYAPYNNAEVLKTLAEAKELVATDQYNNQNVIDATTKALKEATWVANTEEVNAVYNGDFHIGENGAALPYWSNVNVGGYGKSRLFKYGPLTAETSAADSTTFNDLGALQPNDSIRAALYVRYYENPGWWYNYGTAPGYTMPLEKGRTYKFECDIAQWGEGDGNNNIQILDENGTVVGGVTNIHAEHINTGFVEEGAEGVATHVAFSFVPVASGNHRLCFWSPGDKKHYNVISNISIISIPGVESVIGSYSLYKAEFEERNWLTNDNEWHPVVWEKNSLAEVAPYESADEVMIMGFVPGDENITVLGKVDPLARTITIEPQPVLGGEDFDQLYLFCKDSIDADGNYVVTEPVVATIDENFNINIDGWNIYSVTEKNAEGGAAALAEGDDDDVDPGMSVGDTEFVFTPYFRYTKVYLQHGAPTLKAQEITWEQAFDELQVEVPFALNATATSGLDVVYEMDATEVAKLENGVLTFSAPGTVKVTAKQEGNAYWRAAEDVVKDIKLETTGIETIDANDASALFFDLKGRQVREPQSGNIYIVVKGNKAHKAIVK